MCLDADSTSAAALCAGGGLVIAADNGPRCQVLAGPVAAVRELTGRLAQDGVPARVLDSPHGLYSSALADRVAPWRAVPAEVSFGPPARRLVSTVSGTELASGDDIGGLLCTQLTAPVRFAGALSLAASEADLLVETGPGHDLALLAGDCCDVPAVSLDAGGADVAAAAKVMGPCSRWVRCAPSGRRSQAGPPGRSTSGGKGSSSSARAGPPPRPASGRPALPHGR